MFILYILFTRKYIEIIGNFLGIRVAKIIAEFSPLIYVSQLLIMSRQKRFGDYITQPNN